jgi:hypothetical protein
MQLQDQISDRQPEVEGGLLRGQRGKEGDTRWRRSKRPVDPEISKE